MHNQGNPLQKRKDGYLWNSKVILPKPSLINRQPQNEI
jgi:hypothetical protein